MSPEIDFYVGSGSGTCPPSETADYCVPLGGAFQVAFDVTTVPGNGLWSFTSDLDYGSLTFLPASVSNEIVWAPATSKLRAPANPAGVVTHAGATSVVAPYPVSFAPGPLLRTAFLCNGGQNNLLDLMPRSPTNTNGTALASLDQDATVVYPMGDSFTVSCIPAGPGDTDGDGCTDTQEQGMDPGLGGARNFLNRWDFFDTPEAEHPWNNLVDFFGDVHAVMDRFGKNDAGGTASINRYSDPMTPPIDGTSYHPAFDRSAPPMMPMPWDLGAPDGEIDLFTDIFAVAMQFGHTCA